jgi:ATP-binding cassette subfamily F protein 3
MSILVGRNLAQFYGPEEIFSGLSIDMPHSARIALVGPNGAGKTTLMNILIGAASPTEGDVTRARGLRIGHLPQRPALDGQHTVWDEMLNAFAALRQQEAELNRLESAMAEAPAEAHERLLAAYGPLQEAFERAGGYTYEQRIRSVLLGLGFPVEQFTTPIPLLSGGQKTRVFLARLLLEAPDLLALDEPTNHLDIGAIEWLEGFLREYEGAVLVISHDRYFMDAVANAVWELDFGQIETYKGNYSAYVRQRQERHERLAKEFEAQQEFIAKEEAYIRKNIAGQNVAQAKGRRTRLARLLRDNAITRPRTRKAMHLKMSTTVRSGDLVVRTYGVVVGYPDAPALFPAPDLTLRRGEAAALIGPNGAGKSTFVKTLIGALSPHAGEVKLGAGVQVGYFAQAQELLDDASTILDEILRAKPMGVAEARNYLGGFLFTGDDVFRTVGSLSGGERGRVALAKLALSGANLLILDEPTNHLDIPSQEILQNVLADFEGTLILVSHDRYLIEALATQIWAIDVQPTPDGRGRGESTLRVFAGDYAEYLAARAAEREKAAAARTASPASAPGTTGANANGAKPAEPARPAKKHGLNPYQLAKRIAALESEIGGLEAEVASLTAAIEAASARGDAGEVSRLGAAYTAAEAALDAALETWAELAE